VDLAANMQSGCSHSHIWINGAAHFVRGERVPIMSNPGQIENPGSVTRSR
jgi:hypothetical protein